ncbi:MAG: NifU family protein [Nitrospinae bacterium]|nr:NifU family protein [Nitrospinota bacterium]
MSLINTVKKIFSNNDPVKTEGDSNGDESTPPSIESSEKPADNFPELPQERMTINLSVIKESNTSSPQSDEILIKAEPSVANDQCVFMVNRTLMEGYSWYFSSFESAANSSLAEALFSLEDVESALILESTLTLTRKDITIVDWKPLAKEVGAVVRKALEGGGPLISEKIIAEMPSEESVREGIQKSIDTEVNPGVAGHGGHITLQSVKGNTVTIQMGGGCQGCSAADLTLKQGIHSSFRKAVPMVGAILDETDHSAGVNPYF